MKEIIEKLEDWRASRNITEVNLKIKDDLIEEYNEALDELNKGDIEKYIVELSDICIFCLNWLGIENLKYYPIVNLCNYNSELKKHIEEIELNNKEGNCYLIGDIIDICFASALRFGYDMEKVILEKIKVISSREQDPAQKKDWIENGMSRKWIKNKNQDEDSIYVGDFSKCKV